MTTISDILTRMAADASARINEADAKAERAKQAFMAGKFDEYMKAEYDQESDDANN